jgi:hypothetical protein
MSTSPISSSTYTTSPQPCPESESKSQTTTYTLTASDLARKRARDRKSQRAMRDRTKYTLLELQSRVSHLSQTLASETVAIQAEISILKEENGQLRVQVEESRFVGSVKNIERVSHVIIM